MTINNLVHRMLLSMPEVFMKNYTISKARLLTGKSNEVKINMGSGGVHIDGYIGLDIRPSAELLWNLNWGLPFQSETIHEITSNHVLEHLDLPIVVKILRECRRCLKPNGVLDVTVPHFNPYIDAYLSKNYELLSQLISDIPPDQGDLYNTCFDRIAWLLLRAGEHKTLFDQESMLAKLRLAGFENVVVKDPDPVNDPHYRYSSLHFIAIK